MGNTPCTAIPTTYPPIKEGEALTYPPIKEGEALLSEARLQKGWPPATVDMAQYCANKRLLIVGLPGAFTPTWSNILVPGYVREYLQLKAKGIEEVIIYCVNDGSVMTAWGKQQNIADTGGFIKLMQDPSGEFTRSVGLVLEHPGPVVKLGPNRCKRFAMVVDRGTVVLLRVAESNDDPAGDNRPDVTLVENILTEISAS